MSKLTIFAASLIVALAAFSAQAQEPPTAATYCNALAHYAEAVAKDRDSGTPQYQAIEIASRHEVPDIRSDLIFIVQFVHARPHNTPSEEASLAFAVCWANYGE